MAESLKYSAPAFWGARLLTSAGGLGFFPFFPGTVTSLATVAALFWAMPDKTVLLMLLILTSFLGMTLTPLIEERRGKDPSEITLDEVAGQLMTFIFTGGWSLPLLAAGFVLFRLFDIIKPFAINDVQKIPGGAGVVLDDLLAGFYSAVILAVFHYFGVL